MSDSGVPWLKKLTQRSEVPSFFGALDALEMHRFEPKTFLESGSIVVVLIDVAYVVKATGKPINEEDEAHIWHFDSKGLVTKFCHKADTYQHWTAYHNQSTELK